MEEESSKNRFLLERQMEVIELVARHPAGLAFGEIQAALDMPKGTLHRMLAGLCRAGCLDAEPPFEAEAGNARRTYLLGGRMRRLLGTAISPDQMAAVAHTVLYGLVEQFQETAFLSMLRGNRIESIVMATPPKDWHGYVNPGHVMPPHAAASAKAILAFRDEREWEALLDEPLPALTDRTITSPQQLRDELRRVRKTGIAYCREEIDRGLVAVAAPIPLSQVGVMFSVSIVGPSQRMQAYDDEKMKRALLDAASKLAAIFSKQMNADLK
ncbi:IclR family transcriptional regulator [Pigmentiphaga sp.]|uniref:IclR family transcriptional regulator n=1 Tax=Pigmentiphaga sp. TaxID=1977564 RepID=UPI0025E5E294|nr:IclR family transcriptional regulator [Pigmentiphaga sp.]